MKIIKAEIKIEFIKNFLQLSSFAKLKDRKIKVQNKKYLTK